MTFVDPSTGRRPPDLAGSLTIVAPRSAGEVVAEVTDRAHLRRVLADHVGIGRHTGFAPLDVDIDRPDLQGRPIAVVAVFDGPNTAGACYTATAFGLGPPPKRAE